jgi:hypothetical protein
VFSHYGLDVIAGEMLLAELRRPGSRVPLNAEVASFRKALVLSHLKATLGCDRATSLAFGPFRALHGVQLSRGVAQINP